MLGAAATQVTAQREHRIDHQGLRLIVVRDDETDPTLPIEAISACHRNSSTCGGLINNRCLETQRALNSCWSDEQIALRVDFHAIRTLE